MGAEHRSLVDTSSVGNYSSLMNRSETGFTIIELLVTVVVVGILAALAMPSFQDLVRKRNATTVAETFVSDMRFARSESLKRTTPVTVCQSSNSATCSAVAGAWVTGWITFIDFNGNGAVDMDDTLLRVQTSPAGIVSIQNNLASDRRFFTYQANGIARAANQTFFIVPNGANGANMRRLVCVSVSGRVSLRGEGSNVCV